MTANELIKLLNSLDQDTKVMQWDGIEITSMYTDAFGAYLQ